jgi:double-strand break repair protein MRE11
VAEFVDKDDKNSMHDFVNKSLNEQLRHLMKAEREEDEHIEEAMEQHRSSLEALFKKGQLRKPGKTKVKPKPELWDSDLDGPWEDQPGTIYRSETSDDDDDAKSVATTRGAGRGQGAISGRGKGGRSATAASARKSAAAPKKAAATTRGGRGKKPVIEEDDEEESDVQMILNDDDDEDSESMFMPPKKKAPAKTTRTTVRVAPAKKATPASKQGTLNFSQPTQRVNGRSSARPKAIEIVSRASLNDYHGTNQG